MDVGDEIELLVDPSEYEDYISALINIIPFRVLGNFIPSNASTFLGICQCASHDANL